MGCPGSRERGQREANAAAAGARTGQVFCRCVGGTEGVESWAVVQPTLCPSAGDTCGRRTPAQHTLKLFPPPFLFSRRQGRIFEKLRICSMPEFVRFVHDLQPLKKDPDVRVTDLRYGTIPVRLYQPKASSCTLRRGIVFYHGGGGILGSLSESPSLGPPKLGGTAPEPSWRTPSRPGRCSIPPGAEELLLQWEQQGG